MNAFTRLGTVIGIAFFAGLIVLALYYLWPVLEDIAAYLSFWYWLESRPT